MFVHYNWDETHFKVTPFSFCLMNYSRSFSFLVVFFPLPFFYRRCFFWQFLFSESVFDPPPHRPAPSVLPGLRCHGQGSMVRFRGQLLFQGVRGEIFLEFGKLHIVLFRKFLYSFSYVLRRNRHISSSPIFLRASMVFKLMLGLRRNIVRRAGSSISVHLR